MSVERVVLLDDAGRAVGAAPKAAVHHGATPLHLAFSAYLFSAAGDLLVTRRALTKRTFPGVWTNSVCGHPLPGEALPDALARRAGGELGTAITDVRLVIPDFAYRAEMHGVVENELCPVYVAALAEPSELRPDPTEVADVEWADWPTFGADVLAGRRAVSPWCATQVSLLWSLGEGPQAWPTAADALLPPAAQGRVTPR